MGTSVYLLRNDTKRDDAGHPTWWNQNHGWVSGVHHATVFPGHVMATPTDGEWVRFEPVPAPFRN